jgi:hypothetical protein
LNEIRNIKFVEQHGGFGSVRSFRSIVEDSSSVNLLLIKIFDIPGRSETSNFPSKRPTKAHDELAKQIRAEKLLPVLVAVQAVTKHFGRNGRCRDSMAL